MLEKRSSRKNISYASAFGNEDSGDEDFRQTKAPPSKRSKPTAEEKSKKSNSQSSSSGEGKSKQKRKKLDDKLFERELKLAMEMSMQEIGTGLKEEPQNKDASDFQDTPVKNSASERVESLKLSRHDIHSPPKSPSHVAPPLLHKEIEECIPKNSVKQSAMPSLPRAPAMRGPSDEIEYLGTVTDEEESKNSVRLRRTSGRTARKKIQIEPDSSEDEANSDFQEEEEEDESDEEFEEDCDYGKKSTKRNKKTAKNTKTKKDINSVNKKSTTAKRKQTVNKSPSSSKRGNPDNSKSTPSEPSSSVESHKSTNTDTTKVATTSGKSQPSVPSLISVKKPLVTQSQICNLSPSLSSKLPIKQPIWNPPGKATSSTSSLKVTSPSGGIRIGLSRNQKVKSLHPTVKAQH
ncbi:RAD51-associated protein 1 isoform X2 [Octopus sinensis]|uniref:RAD51-associated protein 1 isoform X2 n=1 Tax=Octopus sinensis TaxID=2607531 RepID=A0A6P7SM59_9MOLL|nr:RAD51-associated protein 1 isoform X2 [Octopus sinensis]